ncbi:MAG: NAD-dependent epimerase/dehydratase family protein, partial [Lachnospiraceae bacterium]|nr:NAD-dependent epimerase/dehydratase family protein [Lachnospiraceae bacterium]
MRYLNSEIYRKNVKTAVEHIVGFDVFFNKSVLILGASGLIGSFIADCFIYANENLDARITIYAVSRNAAQLKDRFGDAYGSYLNFIEADVTELDIALPFDYIIHAASYGHPKAFREMPVEVLLSNVVGTQKILEIAKLNATCRVLYVSSGEAQEEVDHLSARACYPMGKRAAETLCISYKKEYDVDVVIARPCHTFGANITENDNRAASQFIMSAAKGINIEMYSMGEQVRTFSYVADCVSGLLTVLAVGESGTVYGISTGESCSVKEFADKCAAAGKCRVEIHMPSGIEKAETSPIANQIVNNDALKNLGWQPVFSIAGGIAETIGIMKEMGRN